MPTKRRTLSELKTKEEIAIYREENRVYQSRFQKRSRLRVKAAELIRNIERRQNYLKISRESMRTIVTNIHLTTKLPYRWSDADYSRAWNTLNNYEKKYLGRVTVPDNQQQRVNDTVDSVNKVLNLAELTVEERAKVAYEVFKQYGTMLYSTNADAVEESDANALLFLAQDNKQLYPDWFHGHITDILCQCFSLSTDRKKFMRKIQSKIMDLNHEELLKKEMEEDNKEFCKVE